MKINLFKTLAHVEGFEKYLHKNFVGAKRFSIEGVDTLVPMLQHTLKRLCSKRTFRIFKLEWHIGTSQCLTHVLENLMK